LLVELQANLAVAVMIPIHHEASLYRGV
jgi:hypothetical protein